jgi:hypothetical protein
MSVSGGRSRSRGSETTNAPSGVVAFGRLPDVTTRSVVVSMALAPAARATRTASSVSAVLPKAFEKRTRSVLPPIETRTIC